MTENRIVPTIPMPEIWNSNGTLEATRERYLTMENLKSMLSKSRIEFFVANVGKPLKRIPVENCFEFWKSEIKPHLVSNPDDNVCLDDYPNEYAYIASEWSGELQTPVVLLEMKH